MGFSSFTLFSNVHCHRNHPEYLLEVQVPEPPLAASDSVDEGRAPESALMAASLVPQRTWVRAFLSQPQNLRRQIKILTYYFRRGWGKAEDFKHNRNFVFSLLLIKNRLGPKETPSGVGNEVITIIIKEQNGKLPGLEQTTKKLSSASSAQLSHSVENIPLATWRA